MKHVEQLILQHLADEDLTDQEQATMKEHLFECDECQEKYDRASDMLRVAADQEPTREQLGRMSRGVVEQLDAEQDPDADPSTPEAEQDSKWGWLRWLGSGLAAAVVLVVAVMVMRQPPRTVNSARGGIPSVQSRGGLKTATGKMPPMVGLEAYAIKQTAGQSARPRLLKDGDTLRLNEFLQFRGLCSGPTVGRIYLVGINGRGRYLDYFPRPARDSSLQLRQCNTRPQRVGSSIKLATRHQVGPLWVLALFSPTALTRDQVQQSLQKAGGGDTSGPDLQKLGLGKGIFPVVRRFKVKAAGP